MIETVVLLNIKAGDDGRYEVQIQIDDSAPKVIHIRFNDIHDDSVTLDGGYETIFGNDYRFGRAFYTHLIEFHQGKQIEFPLRIKGMFQG